MSFFTRHRPRESRSRSSSNASSSSPTNGSMYDCVIMDNVTGSYKTLQGPEPRSGHRIVAEDGFIYCFGGYNPRNDRLYGLYPELWRYSIATRKWKKLPNEHCPEETASHSMLLLGETLMVWGGTGFPFGEKCSNTLHAYHLPTKRWHEIPCSGSKPTPRYGQSMTYKNGSIYVIGGTTGFNYSMKVHKLNLETLFWEDPVPRELDGNGQGFIPEARYRHEIATSGNFIYVLGGGTAQVVFEFDKIPAYNIQSKKWENMLSRPCPVTGIHPPSRKFHAAVQHGNFAYLCGGFDGEKMFCDIWRLDLSNLQWTKLAQTLPRTIYFHSAAVTKSGCMFIFGGVTTVSGETRSNDVFKIWLNVPPLQEMVWEMLVSRYYKFLGENEGRTRDQLRDFGFNIPPKFALRLTK